MKKRAFVCILLALVICLSIPASASAFWEYGMIYDGTELFDVDFLDSYGRDKLPAFRDKYGAELRVDILTSGENAEKEAEVYYKNFLYGADYDGSCATLTIILKVDGDNTSFVDGCIYAGGNEQWLKDAAKKTEESLKQYLNKDSWAGDLSRDNETCTALIKAFLEGMENAASDSGVEPAEESESFVSYSGNSDAELVAFITDNVGIFEPEQAEELEIKAATISTEHECGVYAVIVDDYSYFIDGTLEDFGKSIFDDYHMGWGGDRDGIVLVLSMKDRDYVMDVRGPKGSGAFTEYGREALSEKFLDDFSEDNWADGFSDYLNAAEYMLQQYDEGKPFDTGSKLPREKKGISGFDIVLIIAVPLLAAFLVCSHFKSQMKTACKQTRADRYIAPGGIDISVRDDLFTHSTEKRQAIEQKQNSGAGTAGKSKNSGKSGKF